MEMGVQKTGVINRRPRLNTLGCLLIMGALLLLSFMIFGNSQAGADSISITARVGAPAPSQAAQITSPQSGEKIFGDRAQVEGICMPKTYVTVLSNDLIKGGTICNLNGRFQVLADLSDGNNNLTARTNDGIDQAGPESKAIGVFVRSAQKVNLSVDKAYQRIGLEDTLSWNLNISGVAKVHAVHVDWGDGTSDLLPTTDQRLTLSHKYQKAGAMGIKVTLSDTQNNQSQLNLVASVSSLDTLSGGLIKSATKYLSNIALYITVLLMAASFVVGNYYQGGKKYVWKDESQEAVEIA